MKKKLGNISHGKPSAGMNPLKASQLPNHANIRTDVEKTKSNLKQLANRYIGVTEVKGFLTDLWKALGIDAITQTQQKGGNPSRYAAFQLQDGRLLIVTVRASAHNTDAATFAESGNINGDMNLSLVIRKRGGKDTFKSDDNVHLEEYVYIEHRIKNPKIQNPLSQIALSLVGYLTNGVYFDTTGVAIKNISPIPQPEEEHLSPNELIQQWNHTIDKITENKTYKNMKKNVQRINESQLRAIIAESVKKVLKENSFQDRYGNPAFDDEQEHSFEEFYDAYKKVISTAKMLSEDISELETVDIRATNATPDVYEHSWKCIAPLRTAINVFLNKNGIDV